MERYSADSRVMPSHDSNIQSRWISPRVASIHDAPISRTAP